MKKITFLFFTFCFSALTYSQVVFSEDFEGGVIPATWTNNDIAVAGDAWAVSDDAFNPWFSSGANTYHHGLAQMSGYYAFFNSDQTSNNSAAENVALESPTIDCSSLTSVTLSFNHFFTNGYSGQAFVEVFDGTSWTQVASYGTTAHDFGAKSIDVSTELAGVSNAQVRFRWTGDYSYGWAFDDVTIFQCTVAAPDAVTLTAPADSATNVSIDYGTSTNNLGPFEWTVASTGGAPESFNISLGTNTAGDNIGVISNFTSGNTINYSWAANTTYYWFVEAVNCAGSATSSIFSFTTEACTDTVAPSAASGPVPADTAVDVAVSSTGNGVTFSWTENTPGSSYTLNFGSSNPPTQSFDNFENGGVLNGLALNTTYYWSLDAVNCFGNTTSTVWSFTTAATFSTLEEEIIEFMVYPNPTTSMLNIKSEKDIDAVTIFNMVGQEVKTYTKQQIIDSSINIEHLPVGIYFVKITANKASQTIRVIKQ